MENETVVPETPETPETELQKEVADHPAIEAQIEDIIDVEKEMEKRESQVKEQIDTEIAASKTIAALTDRIAALEAKFNNPAVAHLFA